MDTSEVGARSHSDHHPREPILSRRHLVFGGLAAAGTLGYWSFAEARSGDADDPGRPAPAPDDAEALADRPVPMKSPAATTTTSTTTTTTIPTLDHNLLEGMAGAEVEAMQSLLASRNFDPGPIDGIFGGATLRSVWAFEKLVLGTARTEMQGVVTPDIWDRMNDDFEITPRRTPGGTHMEIYLPEQVSALFVEGKPRVVSHVSSGEGVEWCDVVEIDLDDGTTEPKGICGISITPGGVYHFERKIDGWRNAKLGRLYQPIYFNYGIAIHGAGNVPAYPASRGCVRHPMHIAEYLPDLIEIDDDVFVFDGVEEPETYGPQPMIFDYPDPDWVPPETTTTTTASANTAPTTTAPAATEPATTAPTTTAPSSSTTGPPASTGDTETSLVSSNG